MTVLRFARPWIGGAVIALFSAAAGFNFIIGPALDTELIRALQPGHEPMPPDGCAKRNALTVILGSNSIVNTRSKFLALGIGRCPVLGIERRQDGVAIYAKLYGASGKLIATLTGTTFEPISGGAHLVSQKGGDLTVLSVDDADKNELLYIHYLNPNTLRVRGIFGCPNHGLVVIKDERPIPGLLTGHTCWADPPNPALQVP